MSGQPLVIVDELLAINIASLHLARHNRHPTSYSADLPYKAVEYKQNKLQRAGVGMRSTSARYLTWR